MVLAPKNSLRKLPRRKAFGHLPVLCRDIKRNASCDREAEEELQASVFLPVDIAAADVNSFSRLRPVELVSYLQILF